MIKYQLTVDTIPLDMMDEFAIFNTLIFFDSSVPSELKEISICHTNTGLQKEVCVGDKIYFGTSEATILDVGEHANKNLKELGHLVVLFQQDEQKHQVDLSGQILCSAISFPEITPGIEISIYGE